MNDIKYVSGENYQHFVKEAIELDKVVYERQYIGEYEFYKEAYEASCDNFIFAIDTNGKLAGYLLTTPLKEDAYNRMRSGDCIDIDAISINDLEILNKEYLNQIYIYSIVVAPDYQGYGVSKKLIKLFLNNLDKRRKQGYKVISVMADTINPKAFGNISKHGFNIINVTNHASVLIEKTYPYLVDTKKINLKQVNSVNI